jgi:hypothetical protein
MANTKNDSNTKSKAQDAADKATAAAAEARAAANAETGDKTAAEKKADDLEQKADDLRAKAKEEADAGDGDEVLATAAVDAKVLGVTDPEIEAGDHHAQKFGNDPANPKPAAGVDPLAAEVKLTRQTPDSAEPVVTWVAKEMVGDYLRAGWNKAD